MLAERLKKINNIVSAFSGDRALTRNFQITENKDGFYVNGHIKEGPAGPYTEIIDFGIPLHIVGTVEPIKRFTRARSSRLVITGEEEPEVREAMRNISQLVNSKESDMDNFEDKLRYQETIMPVFERGTRELKKEIEKHGNLEDGNYVIYAPLRGGEFTIAALIYNAAKIGWNIPLDKIACVEEKRVLMEDGRLFIGVRKGYCPAANANTTTIIVDDCISSVRSADVIDRVANEASLGPVARKKACDLSDSEVDILLKRQREHPTLIMVAAASEFGIMDAPGKSKVITGEVVFAINDSLYLMRTSEEGFPEGSFYVGDMGTWLGRLPSNFDRIAPWNKIRRELVNYWIDKDKLPLTLKTNGYSKWN